MSDKQCGAGFSGDDSRRAVTSIRNLARGGTTSLANFRHANKASQINHFQNGFLERACGVASACLSHVLAIRPSGTEVPRRLKPAPHVNVRSRESDAKHQVL
jgi:hypothetical protein